MHAALEQGPHDGIEGVVALLEMDAGAAAT